MPSANSDSKEQDWLPPLVLMDDFDNSWHPFIDAVYAHFQLDFVQSHPRLRGLGVRHRRDPIFDGKEAGFWHCVSQGDTENERLPDIRRCERIRWLRAIIENPADVRVDGWSTKKRGDLRHYLWFNEDYLIAIGDRKHHLLLITAFQTDKEHSRRKLRRERDESQA